MPCFSPYVPFFTNADAIDESYSFVPEKMDLKSAYWLYTALEFVVESHYTEFVEPNLDFQKELAQWARQKIEAVDQATKAMVGTELTKYLTKQNKEIAEHFNEATKQHLADLVTQGTELSKLTFKMDPNL